MERSVKARLVNGSDRAVAPRFERTGRRRRNHDSHAGAAAFVESGYNGTSLRDVAARAGLSHTGLLHHFPDKPALLEAVLDDRLNGPAYILPLDSSDGEVFIRALVDLAELNMHDRANIALLTILSAEAVTPGHPAHDYFKRWHARVRDHIAAAFKDLHSRGRFHSPVSPELAALHVSAMRDGLNLAWLLAPDEIHLADTVRAQFRVYVDLED